MGERRNLLVLGGVVTYNPEIARLQENLSTLINQVDELYIFDNGSKNILEVEKILNQYADKVILKKSPSNKGIAFALKDMMEFARVKKFDWVLSVDQDTVLKSNLVDKYKNIVIHNDKDIGILTCLIKDRNFEDISVEKQNKQLKEVPICITSAAFTNVKKYFLTQGYDTNLFIDLVDTDICFSFREKGFKILRLNYLGAYHEIGHGENKKLFLKKVIVHHSAIFREYFIIRNSIILHEKHPLLYPYKTLMKGLILNFLVTLFYESNKKERFQKYFKGIKDGIKLKEIYRK